MKATLETLLACDDVWLLRLYADEADGHPPYLWCCTVRHEGRSAFLMGADKPLPPGGRQAIEQVLRDNGVQIAQWERWKKGKRRWVEFQI